MKTQIISSIDNLRFRWIFLCIEKGNKWKLISGFPIFAITDITYLS